MLETNILLHGLTFHDEHRDMRMDIDNMSYEVTHYSYFLQDQRSFCQLYIVLLIGYTCCCATFFPCGIINISGFDSS